MKKSTAALLLASSALLFVRRRDKRRRQPTWIERVLHTSHPEGLDLADRISRRYMVYVIVPVWCAAGVFDWHYHRKTKIETTSGTPESITHQLMMIEAGVPIMLGLFLEVNAAVLALMAAGWLAHEITAAGDVDYTAKRRKIPSGEQHTHSFLESIPFNIVATLACLHPDQFLSLLGVGRERAQFGLRIRRPPLPARTAAVIFAATGAFVAAPHLEELWRCWRAEKQGLLGRDTPECAPELYAAS